MRMGRVSRTGADRFGSVLDIPATRRRVVLIALLLLVGHVPAPAARGVPKGTACRLQCNDAIANCIHQGYRPKTCKREVLALCKQGSRICDQPALVCQPMTSTTMTSSTLPPTSTTATSSTSTTSTTVAGHCPSTGGPCELCVFAHCCSDHLACQADTNCTCLNECLMHNLPAVCDTECGGFGDAYQALQQCAANSCLAACQ